MATSSAAESVRTLEWLKKTKWVAVPVYQREYRWSFESAHRLLEDVKSVAAEDDPDATHFLGSMLTIGVGGVTLVDGQQRLMTLASRFHEGGG